MIKIPVPKHLTWFGCVFLFVAFTALSLGVTALLALGVHFVLPQFDYWKEFIALFVIEVVLTSVFRKS